MDNNNWFVFLEIISDLFNKVPPNNYWNVAGLMSIERNRNLKRCFDCAQHDVGFVGY